MLSVNKKWLSIILKTVFAIICILFAMPSIFYLIQNNTILNFEEYFKFLLKNDMPNYQQTFIYLIILALITITYFFIIKNREHLFNKKSSLFLFITIITIIFITVIPFTSSDIFYYLGIGRINSQYGQNPYYTTVKDFVETENNSKYLETDTVLTKGYFHYWADTTVVYGPTWTLICSGVASLSFGNIDLGLLLFKILNSIAHILNCYFIYKITNKKIFVLLYGLNPFMLIEGIANVHNDIFVVSFVLISLYFLLKKRKLLLSLLFLSLATTIKYFTILLLPFIIIYYFRKEKVGKRFVKCIIYGIIFMIMVLLPYLLYIRDLQVLSGIFVQQDKIAKSMYVILRQYFSNIPNVITYVKTFLLTGFIAIYLFTCIELLFKKQIKFDKEIRNYQKFIMIFLFLLITNFQPWYIFWLFPCIMWQKARDIKLITRNSYYKPVCK